jgi:hypothetical protein
MSNAICTTSTGNAENQNVTHFMSWFECLAVAAVASAAEAIDEVT